MESRQCGKCGVVLNVGKTHKILRVAFVDIDSTLLDVISPFLRRHYPDKSIEDINGVPLESCIHPDAEKLLWKYVENFDDEIKPYNFAMEALEVLEQMPLISVAIHSNRTPIARHIFENKYHRKAFPKADFLARSMGWKVIIFDDDPTMTMIERASKVYLIDRPWNRTDPMYDNDKITRVNSFAEAVTKVK